MISFHLNIYIINYVIVVLHKVQRFGGPCLMCIFYVLYYSFHSYMFFVITQVFWALRILFIVLIYFMRINLCISVLNDVIFLDQYYS